MAPRHQQHSKKAGWSSITKKTCILGIDSCTSLVLTHGRMARMQNSFLTISLLPPPPFTISMRSSRKRMFWRNPCCFGPDWLWSLGKQKAASSGVANVAVVARIRTKATGKNCVWFPWPLSCLLSFWINMTILKACQFAIQTSSRCLIWHNKLFCVSVHFWHAMMKAVAGKLSQGAQKSENCRFQFLLLVSFIGAASLLLQFFLVNDAGKHL